MLKTLRSIVVSLGKKLHFLFTFCLLVNFSVAYAEGSKDLYPAGVSGNRAFLYSNSSASSSVSFPFKTLGTHYVYAKKNEFIAVASSVQGISNGGEIRVTAPNGSRDVITVYDGRIPDRLRELNGPNHFGENHSNKYTPSYIPVNGDEGIWKIEFIPRGSETSPDNPEPTDDLADGDWSIEGRRSVVIAAWDISVEDESRTSWREGRVYTNLLNLKLYNTLEYENGAYHGTNYVLTKDGRIYRVKNNGNNGYAFTFFSNNKGFIDAAGSPIYKSLNTTNSLVIKNSVHDPRIADDDVRNLVTHKLFYQPPSFDLPSSAPVILWSKTNSKIQTQTWLKNTAIVPIVTKVAFNGSEAATPNQASQKGGIITFTANVPGTFRITIPIASPGRDKVIVGLAAAGENRIEWKGLDGNDRLVSPGLIIPKIKVKLSSAEVHFPFIDMEINPKGIVIELTENKHPYLVKDKSLDESVYNDRVYWDDSDVSEGMAGEGSDPKVNNIEGSSSRTLGHIWGTYNRDYEVTRNGNDGRGSFSFGNEKAMDTYAYILSNEEAAELNVNIKVADLKIVSITPVGNSLASGKELSYVVKVKNDGPSDITGANFQFLAPPGFQITKAVHSSGTCATESNQNISGSNYSSTLNLKNNCEISYTITGIIGTGMSAPPFRVEANIMRPADVTDPDATNTEFAQKPLTAATECAAVASVVGCNNIMYNDVVAREVCVNSLIAPIEYTLLPGGTEIEITDLPVGLTFRYVSGNVIIDTPPTIPGEFIFTIGTKGNDTKKTTVLVRVKANGLAADIEVTGHVICLGENALLKATSSITGAVFTWYSDAALTNRVGTGSSFEVVAPTADVKYYVTVQSTAVCENVVAQAKVASVKVKANGVAADIQVDDQVICLGSSVTLNATSSITGAVFTWYSDAALTNRVGTGSSFEVVAPTADVKYYVTVQSTAVCENVVTQAKVVSVKVKANGVAADIQVDDQAICLGGSVTLNATSSITGAVFTWYSDAALTNRVGTGSSFEVVAPTADVKYYVTVQSTAVCENVVAQAKVASVKVKANGVAADIQVDDQVICLGSSVTLNATSSITGAVFTWYSDAALTNRVGTGSSFEVVAPTADVKYYVTVQSTAVCENVVAQAKAVSVKVKANGVAADIQVDDQAICLGSSVTLNATSAITGAVFTWYSDAALTNRVGTGSSFEVVSPTADVKYYVTVQSTAVCENVVAQAKVVSVKVKANGVATDIQVDDQAICLGGSVTLNATSAITGAVFTWYSDAALTNRVGTGSSFEVVSPTADVKYYVTVQSTAVCENVVAQAKVVSVKVKANGVAADIQVDDQAICLGSSVTLNATSSITGAVFTWYSDAALTNRVGTGSSFEVVSPTADVKYYVTVQSTAVCENVVAQAKVVSVKVKANGVAADIQVDDQAICLGSSVTLNATSSITGAVFTWYSDAALTNRVGTGSSFEVVAPTADVKYYVTVQSTAVCENVVAQAKVVSVKVKANGVAADIQVDDQAICLGSSVTLNATSAITGAVFTWYSDAALTNRVGTGSSFEVVSPTADVKYYVTVQSTAVCENVVAQAKAVSVKVKTNGVAADIQVDDQAICLGSSVTLNATSSITGAVFTWYSDAALTNRVGTGSSFEVVAPTADVKYYVTVQSTAVCENVVAQAKVVSVKVKANGVAADIQVDDQAICLGSSVTLNATSSITGAVFTWYSDAALTNRVGTGSSFEVVAPTADVKYYVTVKNSGTCENVVAQAKVVSVKVKANGVAADIQVDDQAICLGSSITLNATSAITGAVLTWYSDAALTNRVGTGSSFEVVAPTADVKYYVTVQSTAVCENVVAQAKAVSVKVKANGVAADIQVDDQAICLGSSVTLNATSAITGAVFTWYSDAALTNRVGTGSSFEVVAPTADVKYYVTVQSTAVCENVVAQAKVVSVKVKANGVAADIQVDDQAICLGSSITLNATSAITGAVFTWYSDAALTNRVGTGSSFEVVAPTADVKYYVTVQSTAVCENVVAQAKVVSVKVKANGVAADIQVDDQAICLGSSVTLNATSAITGAVFTWYSDAALTNRVGTGSSFEVVAPTADVKYYVTVKNSGTCENVVAQAKVVSVKVKANGIAADIQVDDQAICLGSSITLNATSAITGAVFTWYTDAALTNRVGTGSSFEVVAPTADVKYYVTVKNSGTCENVVAQAKVVSVKVKANGVAADIQVDDQAICLGSSVTLNATSAITGAVFTWYSDAALTNRVGTGSSFEVVAPTADVKYYVTVKNSGTCENVVAQAKVVSVKVKANGVAADIQVDDQAICLGSSVTLNATSAITGAVFTWYSDAALTNRVGTGLSFEVVAPTADVKYYVTVQSTAVCENVVAQAKVVSVKVKANGVAADIQVDDQVICLGSSVTLNATSAITGAVFTWYSDAALTNRVGAGSSFEVVAPTADVKYYVTVQSTAVCENVVAQAKVVSVKVKANGVAADIQVDDQAICLGSSVTLNATSSITGAVFTWYSDAALTNRVGTGSSFEVVAPTADVKYYVTVKNSGTCENVVAQAKVVSVKVKANGVAADIQVDDQAICLGSSVTLNATSSITGAVFTWYSDAALTNRVGTGSSFEVVAPTADVKYYVTVKNSGTCENVVAQAKVVSVKVKANGVAADIQVDDQAICLGSSITLNATSAITGAVFTWYSDAALTNRVGTGSSFEVVAPTADVKYYVTVKNTNTCENVVAQAKVVSVKVKANGVAADIQVDDQAICLGSSVTLNATSAITGAVFTWYSDAALTNRVGTGSSFEVVAPTADVKYYVTVKNSGTCENVVAQAKVVSVKVKANGVAADIQVDDQAICLGSSITLNATSAITGAVFTWYSDAALTNRVGTGSSFEVVAPTADVKYYVTVQSTAVCENVVAQAKAVSVKVKANGVAADIQVDDQAICLGSSVTLNATSAITGAVFTWYSDAALTNRVGTGSSFEVVAPTADVKYYVTVQSTAVCENVVAQAKVVSVKVKANGVAADIQVDDQAICLGSSITLNATSAITGAVFTWYSDAALTNRVGTGSSFEVVAPTADVKYYVTVQSTAVCENVVAQAKVVSVKVKANGVAADIQVDDQAICLGSSVTLNATSAITGAVFTWYSDAALTNRVGTGSSFEVVAPTADVKYYVTVKNSGTCENVVAQAKVVSVKVKANGVAADIQVDDQAICLGSSVTLNASSAITGAVFTWYSDAALTNRVGTGSSFEVVAPTADVKYYVTVKNSGTCENVVAQAKVVSVKVKANGVAADIQVDDQAICLGSSITLNATSSITGAVFTWYSDAALTNRVGTGSSFEVVAPTADVKYYVTVKNSGTCENVVAQAKVVSVKVKANGVAADIQVDDQAICLGSSVTLNATSAITGAVFTWYSDAALTNRVGTGSSFEVVAPTADVKYYVTVKNSGTCENVVAQAKAVSVKVKANGVAADIQVDDQAICLGSSVTLNATSSITGAVFTWYSEAALTNRVGTGSSFEVVAPTADVKYYVTVKNAGTCENVVAEAKVVTVKVKPRGLAADIQVDDQTICLGGNVTLKATSTITGAVFNWYTDAQLRNKVYTGSDYPVIPTITTTYYVTVQSTAVCENLAVNVKDVTVTVQPRGLASDIQVDDQVICLGSSVTLKATSTITGAVFNWYTDARLRNKVYTGSDYPVTPTITTTYYVTVKNTITCENISVNAKTVKVIVNPLPAIPTLTSRTSTIFCEGGSTILTSSALTGNRWYKDNIMIPNATAQTYTATESGSYTVIQTNTNGCISPVSLPITVTKNLYPVIPGISPSGTTTFCDGGVVTLTSSSATGNQWYKSGILIPGATHPTYDVSEIGVYTVNVTNTAGCTSAVSASTTVTVNPVPKGFDDQINTLSCSRSTFTYNLQSFNINNTIRGGNGVPSSFTWTVNPTTVSGAVDGFGNAITASLINTGMSPEEVIYTVTPRGLSVGCDGLPFKIKVLVPVCSAISITKTADRSSVAVPGDQINYTITVSNVANASHHNLIVNDPLTGGNLSNPTGDNGNHILEKGEFWTYHTSYVVTQTDLDNNGAPDTDLGEVQNIATVKSTESPTPRTAVANVAIRQNPIIRLVKTGVLNQDYRTINYTFFITNKGNITLKDLQLTDPKLPGLSIPNLTELGPGASTSVTATYTIKEIEKRAGTVINTAKVTGTYNLGSRVSDISGTNENNDDPTVVDIIRYPSAVDDFAKTKADIEVMVPVTNNDRPSLFPLDVATVDVKVQPINGKLQLNRDGKVVYHPNKGYVGLETFTYMVNDDNGLSSNVAVVTINVIPADLEIPNTFTPNGDGKNDTFLIKGRENYESIEISIFNRWGDEVYKNKNYKDEWDGAGLNEGTYFYVLRLKKAGKEEIRRSWVLIKR